MRDSKLPRLYAWLRDLLLVVWIVAENLPYVLEKGCQDTRERNEALQYVDITAKSHKCHTRLEGPRRGGHKPCQVRAHGVRSMASLAPALDLIKGLAYAANRRIGSKACLELVFG
jgi:hypothetical protein